ncbi:hypothetical protein TWF106_006257 [Orbilia oligospora]|uniref:Uncharacterized protein n=1 Tax=Orbilia oligospora TaxID=2813651 RepID=A0A7C8QXF4_ORBOL|nr:hypothetical protein TWF106_006257 [Orbilia oligospora]KAF3230817.1 hypothetical protein TWF191_008657 [Orbilia oligospora]
MANTKTEVTYPTSAGDQPEVTHVYQYTLALFASLPLEEEEKETMMDVLERGEEALKRSFDLMIRKFAGLPLEPDPKDMEVLIGVLTSGTQLNVWHEDHLDLRTTMGSNPDIEDLEGFQVLYLFYGLAARNPVLVKALEDFFEPILRFAVSACLAKMEGRETVFHLGSGIAQEKPQPVQEWAEDVAEATGAAAPETQPGLMPTHYSRLLERCGDGGISLHHAKTLRGKRWIYKLTAEENGEADACTGYGATLEVARENAAARMLAKL